MKILFCKVSGMKYYKGACEDDKPYNGGLFVEENGYGHEEFNFLPIELEGREKTACVGFVEPKSNRGVRNTIHIENIEGCSAYEKDAYVDDVLVIWCATRLEGDITVVGWYKNAKVFRELQEWTMMFANGTEEDRCYNVLADSENCTLLPEFERNRSVWEIPLARKKTYGFGQSMVWYPTDEKAKTFVERVLSNIENYRGDNWINKYPKQ